KIEQAEIDQARHDFYSSPYLSHNPYTDHSSSPSVSIPSCSSSSARELTEQEKREQAEMNFSMLTEKRPVTQEQIDQVLKENNMYFPRYSSYKKCVDQSGVESLKLLDDNIPGLRFSIMSDELAHEVLKNCPQEIEDIIYKIKHDMFDKYEKNIILSGFAGLGKSAVAEAVAKKSSTKGREIKCFLIDAEIITTSYLNSGVQNLEKIFELAAASQPCVVVLDELEALTNKHVNKNSEDNNVVIALWKRLDKYSKDKIVVIGTMNSTKNLPVQVSSRATIVKMSLPNKEKRHEIINFYMNSEASSKGISFAQDVTAWSLAEITDSFSPRELERLVTQVTFEAHSRGPGKMVTMESCLKKITGIRQAPARKKEREIDTWRGMINQKNAIRAGQCLVAVAGVAAVCATFYYGYKNQQLANASFEHNKAATLQSQIAANESLAMQAASIKLTKTGMAVGAGGVVGGGIGTAIGAAVGGASAAAAAAPLGPVAMAAAGAAGAKSGAAIGGGLGASAGATIGFYYEPIWNGTKWIAVKTWNGTGSLIKRAVPIKL
ncbi:MAG: ATP-binding protein, partial [Candidatus Babeliales bacterium]|nr:ATP-binding protein [Candidatus Babeliales bacterium]